jgi:hypothetical protein
MYVSYSEGMGLIYILNFCYKACLQIKSLLSPFLASFAFQLCYQILGTTHKQTTASFNIDSAASG